MTRLGPYKDLVSNVKTKREEKEGEEEEERNGGRKKGKHTTYSL